MMKSILPILAIVLPVCALVSLISWLAIGTGWWADTGDSPAKDLTLIYLHGLFLIFPLFYSLYKDV